MLPAFAPAAFRGVRLMSVIPVGTSEPIIDTWRISAVEVQQYGHVYVQARKCSRTTGRPDGRRRTTTIPLSFFADYSGAVA